MLQKISLTYLQRQAPDEPVIQDRVAPGPITSRAVASPNLWTQPYASWNVQYQQLTSHFPPQPVDPSLIVVIDDSVTVRKILETCLCREGFHVKGFADGIEAIRWLMSPDARIPRFIILDIGLPRFNGYEVARYLKARSQFSKTVILMLSCRDGIVDCLKGRLAGAEQYLSKPFQTQVLTAVVRSYISEPLPQG